MNIPDDFGVVIKKLALGVMHNIWQLQGIWPSTVEDIVNLRFYHIWAYHKILMRDHSQKV